MRLICFFFLGLRLLGPIDVAKLHTTTHILQLFAAVAAPLLEDDGEVVYDDNNII